MWSDAWRSEITSLHLFGHLTFEGSLTAFKCELCEQSFFQSEELQQHLNSIHGLCSIDPDSKCEICGKLFSKAPNLKRHTMGVHEDVGAFKCEVCEKPFSRKYKLIEHVRMNRPTTQADLSSHLDGTPDIVDSYGRLTNYIPTFCPFNKKPLPINPTLLSLSFVLLLQLIKELMLVENHPNVTNVVDPSPRNKVFSFMWMEFIK
ncbi:hypothetical protein ACTXT7_015648, partial [Hymenolepis weldensis]